MSSILTEINTIIDGLDLPVETGVFSGVPPDEYVVIEPLFDTLDFHADNRPQVDIQEVRLSLFSKNNYIKRKNQLIHAFIAAELTITARRYIGFEQDTKFYHYAIDVANYYEMGD